MDHCTLCRSRVSKQEVDRVRQEFFPPHSFVVPLQVPPGRYDVGNVKLRFFPQVTFVAAMLNNLSRDTVEELKLISPVARKKVRTHWGSRARHDHC